MRFGKRQGAPVTTVAALNATDLGNATVTAVAAVTDAATVTVTQTVTVTDLAGAKNGTEKGEKKKGKDKKQRLLGLLMVARYILDEMKLIYRRRERFK
jgi:hypothetical protein